MHTLPELTEKRVLTSGNIKVKDVRGREPTLILDEQFKSRRSLRKLMFLLKGTGYEVTVTFDE